jgi:hypothetical protein
MSKSKYLPNIVMDPHDRTQNLLKNILNLKLVSSDKIIQNTILS